jgi:serine/threonine protein phosphatase PrpC
LPHGDALARCLGTFVVENQRLIPVNTQPDVFEFALTRGDTLLLATDGLIDFAGANVLHSEDNVLSVLLSEPDPALACLELILLANRGGGGDNIGVAISKFY